MNKKLFGIIFSFVLIFTIFPLIINRNTNIVSAATSGTLSFSSLTSTGVTLSISGASPSQDITIYIFNDPNLSPTPSFSVNASVTTDDFGNASANFVLLSAKSYVASTSLMSAIPSISFSTPPGTNSNPPPTSSLEIQLKSGTLTSNSVTVEALGTVANTSYRFSIYDTANYPSGSPLATSLVTSSPFEASFSTGLLPNQTYVATLAPSTDPTSVVVYTFTTLTSNANANGNGNTGTNTVSNTGTNTATFTSSSGNGIIPACNVGPIVASTGMYANPCDFNFFIQLINNIIKFLLFVIATPLVALIIMYTGYLYLTSGGSNQTEKAKHILFNVVVGYVIALAAWLIINAIITSLNLDPTINTFLK